MSARHHRIEEKHSGLHNIDHGCFGFHEAPRMASVVLGVFYKLRKKKPGDLYELGIE